MAYHTVKLNEKELFRLRLMDAYKKMDPKNVRYLCKLFGIHHSTFYRLKKQYNPYKLVSIKYKSRKPKTLTINWSVVTEVCEWKRNNPKKSHYYLYHEWIREGRIPPCSPKTIYNWWKRRNLIIARHKRKRRSSKLFNQAKNPGELIQIDTKHLPKRKYQYTAIDVTSKWRYLSCYKAFNAVNSIDFVEKLLTKAEKKGLRVKLVQTDNGPEFQSLFTQYLTRVGINHQYTWIHTPDQNGCVERSHRTDEEEFYQENDIDYTNLDDLNRKLEDWVEYYNTKRLHFSLNFATPEEYLVSHI